MGLRVSAVGLWSGGTVGTVGRAGTAGSVGTAGTAGTAGTTGTAGTVGTVRRLVVCGGSCLQGRPLPGTRCCYVTPR